MKVQIIEDTIEEIVRKL